MIATLAANTARHTPNASFSSCFRRNFGGQNFVKLKKKHWNALNLALVVAISNYTHSKSRFPPDNTHRKSQKCVQSLAKGVHTLFFSKFTTFAASVRKNTILLIKTAFFLVSSAIRKFPISFTVFLLKRHWKSNELSLAGTRAMQQDKYANPRRRKAKKKANLITRLRKKWFRAFLCAK